MRGRYFKIGASFILGAATIASAQVNIAPSGSGYYWYGMKTATAVTNQTSSSLINNGNDSNTLNCDPDGEESTDRYEGAGVVFQSAQSDITSVAFINGPLDPYGNGNFEANLSLQRYNGNSWTIVPGWTVTPTYPYTSGAAGQTYTFTGPALNDVLGLRMVGEVRLASVDSSYSWTVNQVLIRQIPSTSPNFALSTTVLSRAVVAGASADYKIDLVPRNGFSGRVDLSVSGAPTGWDPTLSASSIAGGSGSFTLKAATTPSATTGTYTLTVKGTSKHLTQTTSVTLTVNSIDGSKPANWMGYRWNVDPDGTCIGDCEIKSKASNLSVDALGELHVGINKREGTWTGSEMFTADNLGFGTYQWVLKGDNFYDMDPPIDLGLFNYGPANGIGVDSTDEIDIEFARFNTPPGVENVDFTAYPATGHQNSDGSPSSDEVFYTPRPGCRTTTTVRFVWTATSITWYVMNGTVGVNAEPKDVTESYVYQGTKSTIPQTALPVGINLWAYEALPTHPWNIVLQSFTYLK